MKKIRFLSIFLIVVVTSTACVVDGSIGSDSSGSLPQITPSPESDVIGTVTADDLYLRDAPEEFGGKPITSLPNGADFVVTGCAVITSSGTSWAYGSYTDPDGTTWTGWAASRYIDGACP